MDQSGLSRRRAIGWMAGGAAAAAMPVVAVAEEGKRGISGTLRQMGAARRAAVALWQARPALARYVLKSRNNIDGVFSVLATAGGMSFTLPSFARRLHRVRRWVGAKIILYHAMLRAKENLAAVA